MESLTREIADCVVDRFAASPLQDDITARVVTRMQAQIAVEHDISARVVERVKAWRIVVTVLGLLGLFVGLYSSRLPVGLTVDLMACPYNYNKLDTKYALELEVKKTQLAVLESKYTLELESKHMQLAELEWKLCVLVLYNQRLMLEVDGPTTSNLKKCTCGVNDILWV
jgi:hypothetical protein